MPNKASQSIYNYFGTPSKQNDDYKAWANYQDNQIKHISNGEGYNPLQQAYDAVTHLPTIINKNITANGLGFYNTNDNLDSLYNNMNAIAEKKSSGQPLSPNDNRLQQQWDLVKSEGVAP